MQNLPTYEGLLMLMQAAQGGGNEKLLPFTFYYRLAGNDVYKTLIRLLSKTTNLAKKVGGLATHPYWCVDCHVKKMTIKQ